MKQYKKPSVLANSETPHIVPLAVALAAPPAAFLAGAAIGLGMSVSKKGNRLTDSRVTPLRRVEVYT